MEESIFQNPAVIWIICGVLGLLLELLVPGLIIIFFGVGALVTSAFCWIFNIPIELQLLIFLISSMVLLGIFRKVIKKSFKKENIDSDNLEEEFVGKIAHSVVDFENNTGKIDFKGTTWNAYSEDSIKAGDSVEIVKRDSITLIVKLNKN